MGYRVLVDDNFHYLDRSHRSTKGEYPTYEEALAVCQRIVDRCLLDVYVSGMPAEKLYFSYTMFGEDPFIAELSDSPDTSPGFSAWTYAKARCEEICSLPSTSFLPGS